MRSGHNIVQRSLRLLDRGFGGTHTPSVATENVREVILVNLLLPVSYLCTHNPVRRQLARTHMQPCRLWLRRLLT